MNLPNIVTNELLATLAAPDETHCVRVLVRRVLNHAPFAIRGRHRKYMASHVPECGCHALDVPLSVWQDGIAPGIYRDNLSIAQDLQSTLAPGSLPLIFMVLPWKGAKAVIPAYEHPDCDVFGPLLDLCDRMDAPAVMVEALKLAQEGHAGALKQFIDGFFADPERPEPSECQPPEDAKYEIHVDPPTKASPSDRIRKMNEARAAKRAAQLQPA